MIQEDEIEELPGFAVVQMEIGGGLIIRDNSDWHTFINNEGHAIKTQKLPNLRMKWGYAEEW